jgi:hypothetical protein
MNPSIGRMDNVDGLASHPNQISLSPYNAFWNNPIKYVDPDGNCPSCPQGADAANTYGVGAIVENKDGTWTWSGTDWQTNQSAEVSDRSIASAMPFSTAFGMGIYGGLAQTGQFISSLGSPEGWRILAQGMVNTARMGNITDTGGMLMRSEMATNAVNYLDNIPEMTAGEAAYDLGYGTEKVAEAVLTRKVMPISKASLGLRRGLGSATPYTNMISYGLNGKLGSLSVRVPTPIVGLSAKSKDLGLILSRNLITPVGYGIGVGQLQYLQKRK